MRLLLEVGYHGAKFNGWQSQRCGNTVQDHLEKAFAALCPEPVQVHGAGRTDAGVHALAQCAHADVPDKRFAPAAWVRALNAHLPSEIRVVSAREVPPDFHARFSATGKTYRYRVWNSPALHPLEADRAWHVPGTIDSEKLAAACRLFTGEHDFAAFSARRSKREEDTVRTIHRIAIDGGGPRIDLVFTGTGFLYKMVRMLVAAIVRHAQDRVELGELRAALKNGSPRFSHTAPACGLCLERVFYEGSCDAIASR